MDKLWLIIDTLYFINMIYYYYKNIIVKDKITYDTLSVYYSHNIIFHYMPCYYNIVSVKISSRLNNLLFFNPFSSKKSYYAY